MKLPSRKLRFLFIYPLAVWLFLSAHSTTRSLRLGIVVIILGEALRLWANAYVGAVKVNTSDAQKGGSKIGHLITGGPYACVRNPLYLGTLLIGLGFCVAAQVWWIGLIGVACFYLIYSRKIRSEEATLRQEWGEEAARYQQRVPRWLPIRGPYDRPYGRPAWTGIQHSHEFQTVVWLVVAVVALYFRQDLWQKHRPFWTAAPLKHVVLASVVAVLVTTEAVRDLRKRGVLTFLAKRGNACSG